MSMQPQSIKEIPAQTVEVARATFRHGNPYMTLRDELGTIFEDEPFADLFPTRGQPAIAPWQLAFIMLMQFADDLTDRQTAEQVRARIDWKYALGLELTDAGFDFSVLSEFRSRLVEGAAETLCWLLHLSAGGDSCLGLCRKRRLLSRLFYSSSIDCRLARPR